MKMRNDYDYTKKMLNTLRNLSESKTSSRTLREQEEPQNPEQSQQVNGDIVVINDVDVKMLSTDEADMKLMDDQKSAISGLIDNFRQQVSQIVDFDPGMTINERQIRLDGKLTDEDISFVMIAGEESGVYVNAEMLKIESETLVMLEKLVKFEETYKTTMEPMITQRDNNI
jgi:hypothetical protein